MLSKPPIKGGSEKTCGPLGIHTLRTMSAPRRQLTASRLTWRTEHEPQDKKQYATRGHFGIVLLGDGNFVFLGQTISTKQASQFLQLYATFWSPPVTTLF